MSINIIDQLTKKLHDFEQTIPDKEWEVWEAIRFDLYYEMLGQILGNNSSITDSQNSKKKRKRYGYLLKNSLAFIPRIIQNRHKYLFLPVSRFENTAGEYYDPNILDAYQVLHKHSVIIEAPHKEHFQYKLIINPFNDIMIRLYKRLLKKHIPQSLKNRIEQEFNLKINWTNLDNSLRKYYADKHFFSILFRIMKPQAVFVTQSGIQKGLFRSAKVLNIPTIEFQHGIIYFSHLNYSYSSHLNQHKLSIPDFFITYSNFWTEKIKNIFPVKQIIDCGNTAASKLYPEEEVYDLTFICCSADMKWYLPLVNQLQEKGFKGKICLKLHPQQFNEEVYLQKLFENNPLVEIVAGQKNMKKVIGQSKNLITIQSTSVYEALDAGKPVYIIKDGSFMNHEDVFEHPLVSLVSDASDVIKIIGEKTEIIETEYPRFFAPFDASKFKSFVESKLESHE